MCRGGRGAAHQIGLGDVANITIAGELAPSPALAYLENRDGLAGERLGIAVAVRARGWKNRCMRDCDSPRFAFDETARGNAPFERLVGEVITISVTAGIWI